MNSVDQSKKQIACHIKADVGGDFIHVHQCATCLRLSFAEEFTARDLAKGLFECPSCRSSEPLRTEEEREADDLFKFEDAFGKVWIDGCQASAQPASNPSLRRA